MKLKGPDRVCFSTSARARVLPDHDEQEAMPVATQRQAPYTYGRTRIDENMQAIITALSSYGGNVKVESHSANKLMFTGPRNDKVVLPGTLMTDGERKQFGIKMSEIGINIHEQVMAHNDPTPTVAFAWPHQEEQYETVPAIGGFPVTTKTLELVESFLVSFKEDIKIESERQVSEAETEMMELLAIAERERDAAREELRRAEGRHEKDMRDMKARAEKAEGALARFNAAIREANALVPGP